MFRKTLRFFLVLCFSLCILCDGASANEEVKVAELNQGWSQQEIQFYNHASEGSNIAPLEFVLNLPDSANSDSKFIEKISSRYGFIPDQQSDLNPYGLPIGLAVDQRPMGVGDRPYLGVTCAACHTRQLTYHPTNTSSSSPPWALPVHGGPGLVDFPRFLDDLYSSFFALLSDDVRMETFATDVLGRTPHDEEIDSLRDEIRTFTGPYSTANAIMEKLQIPVVDSGPGNLDALTRGYYNNVGIVAWMVQQGITSPSDDGSPLRIPLQGGVSYPPLWFGHQDTWAQWFAEIHHPGARNWIQSVSTSSVRPPKMIETFKRGAVLASIDFDNIEKVQDSLERLRTPKWPAPALGPLDQPRIERGKVLFNQNCAQCHTSIDELPNRLGLKFNERLAFDVGTDPVAYQIFSEKGEERAAGLLGLSKTILELRRTQLEAQFGRKGARNQKKHDSRGRPNKFAVAKEYGGLDENSWEKSGAVYWAPPMEGIFTSSPYFHNGSVPTLWDVLSVPEQRPSTFQTGGNEFDPERVGIKSAGPFLYDTREKGKSNGGHLFGTKLAPKDKVALIEYLKSR